MCTFSCALFQTWDVPSKCLSLSLSLSVCLSLSLITAPLPAKYTFGESNQYWIMASTHLLCILLDGLLHERSPTLIVLHKTHPGYAGDTVATFMTFVCDVIPLLSSAQLLLRQRLHSICRNRQLSIALRETE